MPDLRDGESLLRLARGTCARNPSRGLLKWTLL